MTTLLPFALALCSQNAPPKPDLEKLQGTWVLVSVVDDGQAIPMNGRRIIRGATYTDETNGRRNRPVAFRLDETQTPKTWEIKPGNVTYRSIYRVEADTLTICAPSPLGMTPPNGFTSNPGERNRLIVFKRETD